MRILALTLVLSCAAVSSLQAQLTVFTDRTDWENALGGLTVVVEDFNSIDPFVFSDGQTLVTSSLSVTRDGSQNNADGFLAIADGSEFGNLDGTNFLDGETGVEPHEVVSLGFLGRSTFAFVADFFSPFSGDGIALSIAGETVLLDSIAGFDSGFVGVISNNAFDTVDIIGNPDALSFQELWSADNVSYAVPEPSSAVCLAFACVGLAMRRRKRR